MDEKYLEIGVYPGEGYRPVVDHGFWRVAILNYSEDGRPEKLESVERHNATDEVFVLLKGQAILFLGDGLFSPECLLPQAMEPGKIYNVKKGIWHTIALSQDASILIVENRDTDISNSDFSPLKPEHRQLILETVCKEQFQDQTHLYQYPHRQPGG
jgi:mannose-6-phosphate isomerase-like protein (cupin superfamily)